VAVRNPVAPPSEEGGYQKNYASGVIITADGVVLSQWHVSHWKASEQGGRAVPWEKLATCSAGDKTTVVLHDGRECPAELLGANRTHDVSLLRLLEPGPYPHVPIHSTVPVQAGDWVLKVGHPFGYRKGRSAPLRLGRIICGTEEIFGTDCLWSGGDSGGPYFTLDGQLLGIFSRAPSPVSSPDAGFVRRTGGSSLALVTGSKLIHSLIDEMLGGEVSPYDMQESGRIERQLATRARLRADDYFQGRASLAHYRSIVEATRSSVVVVLNKGVAVGLGSVVGHEGWILTKASETPSEPKCRLPDGKVVSARVVGVEPASDLALLSVRSTGLKPVQWATEFNPPVGTLLAAVGTTELPLAVGVVSVPRRDLDPTVRRTNTLPLRIAAGRPEAFGRPQPISGYSLRAAFGLPRRTAYHLNAVSGLAWSSGVRPGDLLHTINGQPILVEEDLNTAVDNHMTGDVVPIRLERAGKMIDLRLALGPEPRIPDASFRADGFPTVIECAVPFYSYECGGPVVDLTGRTIGITIARVGLHGGMVIPGDCILRILQDLQAGRFTEKWSPGNARGK